MGGVSGAWEAGIKIADKLLPVSGDTLRSLMVRANTQYKLPTFSLDLFDTDGGMLKNYDFIDGAPVTLMMGDGTGNGSEMNFNILGGIRNLQTMSGGSAFTISGILDKPSYLRKITSGAIQGASSEVISKLAQAAGFKSIESHATSDRMTWLPNNTPISQYIKFVANRGWRSATSLMLHAVTENSVFKYLDIDSLIKGKPALSLDDGGNGFRITDCEVKNKMSLYNSQRGYGATALVNTLEGPVSEMGRIPFIRLSPFLSASKQIASELGKIGSRVEHFALDCGNVHPNYNTALHQNRTLKSLYGNEVAALVSRVTGAGLLSMVSFNPMGIQAMSGLASYAGNYILSGKVISIVGGKYYEKLGLVTQGTGKGTI